MRRAPLGGDETAGAPVSSSDAEPAAGGFRAAAGFLLDLARCVGCGACAVACRMENALPPGVSWRRVLPLNLARSPRGPTYHLSVACHHCEEPPCAKACPTGALEKRPDGVVVLHQDRCIGCRYCEMACPFGAPAFDEAAGVMTKCHLCHPRIDRGLAPACVAACPTRALRYADDMDEAPPRFLPAATLPGFADPAGAGPSLRLAPPAGEIREEALERLQQVLKGGGHV